MGVLAKAKKQGELSSDVDLDVMADFFKNLHLRSLYPSTPHCSKSTPCAEAP